MAKRKPIPDDCMPKCGSCAFFQSESGDEAGYCRRYPPKVVSSEEGEYSAFPVVEVADWCGEFRRLCN